MIYDTSSEIGRGRLKEACIKALAKPGLYELKQKKQPRTMKQNSYLHVIIAFFASQYGCTEEEAKIDFFKREANRVTFEREVTNKRGQKVKTLRSTAELDKAEMMLVIDRFRNWSAMVAGIYLPSPSEQEALIYCMNEIDAAATYL